MNGSRAQRAAKVALAHLLFLAIVQVESHALYVATPGARLAEGALFLVALPALELENAIFAALLGATTLLLPPRRWADRLAVALASLANAYSAVDQVGFKVFLDHLRPSWREGLTTGAGLVLDSFRAEAGPVFYGNLVLVLALAVVLGGWIASGRPLVARAPRWKRALPAALVVLGASALAARRVNASNLEHHPIFTFLGDLVRRRGADERLRDTGARTLASLSEPISGEDATSPAEARALLAARAALARRADRPDILLIVIESVGASQLSEADPPFLHELAARGVLLDSVYTSFPSTVRSHVALELGGRTITYGSVYEELGVPTSAPSLPGELGKLGYATGCFDAAGETSNENMERFYAGLGFDAFVHFENRSPAFQAANRVNSWGAGEEPFVKLALEWLDGLPRERPFFLAFTTNATHHPYAGSGASDKERYQSALRATDAALGKLVAGLEARGLLQNTIVAVTGDHGESFEEWHRGNLLHRNRIYEENVRTFLLLADGKRPVEPVRAHRIGAMGDVMPTLLALAGAQPAAVPGQDLLGPGYRPRTVFMHKSVIPELWGLRDGRWKFIERAIGEPLPELYDLDADPHEQTNLATTEPARTAAYHERCRSWFVAANADFVEHLEAKNKAARLVPEAEVTRPGPKTIRFGRTSADQRFTDLERTNPYDEDAAALVLWTNYHEDRHVRYEWRAPSGEKRSLPAELAAGTGRTVVRVDATWPLEEGRWRFAVLEGEQALLAAEMVVARDAPLLLPLADCLPRLLELSGGARRVFEGREQFRPSRMLEPGERPALLAKWAPRRTRVRVRVSWRTPGGVERESPVEVVGPARIVEAPSDLPLERGVWHARVATWESQPLGEVTVEVP